MWLPAWAQVQPSAVLAASRATYPCDMVSEAEFDAGGQPAAPPSTLLLLDDDPRFRALLKATLEHERYHVVDSPNAEEALYELTAHTVDLALVDIGLPGMDGLELCREIRRRGRIPVVAITAHTPIGDILDTVDPAFDSVLTKPVDEPAMLRTIRELVATS